MLPCSWLINLRPKYFCHVFWIDNSQILCVAWISCALPKLCLLCDSSFLPVYCKYSRISSTSSRCYIFVWTIRRQIKFSCSIRSICSYYRKLSLSIIMNRGARSIILATAKTSFHILSAHKSFVITEIDVKVLDGYVSIHRFVQFRFPGSHILGSSFVINTYIPNENHIMKWHPDHDERLIINHLHRVYRDGWVGPGKSFSWPVCE